MDAFINPYVLFIGLAIAGVGVAMAAPRKRVNPQVIGAVLAGLGLGVVLLGLAIENPGAMPNLHFYVFGLIALGASLRVITHPRPVYAALYFILTVLASCGLYLVLSAEFMAFALVIIYAGAILITYLFVIMLATQAPTEDRLEALAEYDVQGRAPLAATVASFVLLAALTSLVFRGVGQTEPAGPMGVEAAAVLPGRLERVAERAGLIADGETVRSVNAGARTMVVADGAGAEREVAWPEGATATNVEAVGVDLLLGRPGTIEIAGVILLMAMLGATVLARRQVDLEEEAKRRAAADLAARGGLLREEVRA